MPPANSKPAGLREIDFASIIRHYLLLLWQGRWWLCVATPASLIGALLLFRQLINASPALTATAMIGMEPIAGITDIPDVSSTDAIASSELIKSRTFLVDIVEALSLRLKADYNRCDLFDSVRVDSLAPSQIYRFEINKHSPGVYTVTADDRRLIGQGTLATLDTLRLPGVFLKMTHAFLQSPHGFSLTVSPLRLAVEGLYGSLSLNNPLRMQQMQRNPSFDVSTFGISIKGTDYKLITATINTIADKYVEKNLHQRQSRTLSVLSILQKQLVQAKAELTQSEEQLRAFRTANPALSLSEDAARANVDLADAARVSLAFKTDMMLATELQAKLRQASGEEALNPTREAFSFLKAHDRTTTLEVELTRLTDERRVLIRSYDRNHPLVVQNQTALNAITSQTQSELQRYIQEQNSRQLQNSQEIEALSAKMRALPAKQLALAELMRQQQVNADIYSRVLDKYNQAKVTDVVKVADLYVMDYAVPPVPPPTDPLGLLGMCVALCLAVVFLPLIIFDVLSKSVWTESELRRILPVAVLASIPVIKTGRRQSALIENEYVKEIFRALRTKIQYGLNPASEKSVLITSLEASAGKTTLTANMAICFAQQNFKVVVIDGDMRCGMQHQLFGLEPGLGLSDYLISPAMELSAVMAPTSLPNLQLIPAGSRVANTTELLGSARFLQLKRRLLEDNDIVFLDTPPMGLTSDAVTVCASFASVVLVARAGQTNVVDFKQLIDEYPALNQRIMGIVLNCSAFDARIHYYRNSKYYRQSKAPNGQG
jgi:capsular exopolysaccharide synthesis family protein